MTMEQLFLVEMKENEAPHVLGRLINGQEKFKYIPLRNNKKSAYRWAAKAFEDKQLPLFLTQRVFSQHNLALPKFLKGIGLENYDVWEILKRSKGGTPGDNLKFVTENELVKLQGRTRKDFKSTHTLIKYSKIGKEVNAVVIGNPISGKAKTYVINSNRKKIRASD
jgi:hypothetical protein